MAIKVIPAFYMILVDLAEFFFNPEGMSLL